jgi:hypothetical protein
MDQPNPPPTKNFSRMPFLSKLTSSTAPSAVIIVRLMVGFIFLSEGIQKFMFPGEVGAGRFAKLGLPSPEFLAPFVGGGAWSLDRRLHDRFAPTPGGRP